MWAFVCDEIIHSASVMHNSLEVSALRGQKEGCPDPQCAHDPLSKDRLLECQNPLRDTPDSEYIETRSGHFSYSYSSGLSMGTRDDRNGRYLSISCFWVYLAIDSIGSFFQLKINFCFALSDMHSLCV